MGMLTEEAVSTDLICAGISSLPSMVCVYHYINSLQATQVKY